VIARLYRHRLWIWPVVAVAVTLLALQFMDHVSPLAAFVLGGVLVVLGLARLAFIAFR